MILFLIAAEDGAKWAQIAAWIAAVIVGFFSVTKIVYELRQTRRQREEELKWKKAAAAKELIDELFDSRKAKDAMKMLDWDGSSFEIANGVTEKISFDEMIRALRTEDTNFSKKEEFIRDSFDGLFYHLGMLQHYVARELVEFEDVSHPIDYYVKLMAPNQQVYGAFLKTYGFHRTEKFMDRFEDWSRARKLVSQQQRKALTEEARDTENGK